MGKVNYTPWLKNEGYYTGLLIEKTARDVNGSLLAPGDQIRYNLVISNSGNIVQHNLLITNTLPAGLTLVGATPAGFSSPNPLRWQPITLNASVASIQWRLPSTRNPTHPAPG